MSADNCLVGQNAALRFLAVRLEDIGDYDEADQVRIGTVSALRRK